MHLPKLVLPVFALFIFGVLDLSYAEQQSKLSSISQIEAIAKGFQSAFYQKKFQICLSQLQTKEALDILESNYQDFPPILLYALVKHHTVRQNMDKALLWYYIAEFQMEKDAAMWNEVQIIKLLHRRQVLDILPTELISQLLEDDNIIKQEALDMVEKTTSTYSPTWVSIYVDKLQQVKNPDPSYSVTVNNLTQVSMNLPVSLNK